MRKQVPTIQGRSFLFNTLFVVLNLLGLVLVVLGAQPYFHASFFALNFAGYTLIGIAIIGILIFQGKLMMANVSRAIVGAVFIVSGLIKANDPIGFAYKLEEYFQDGALAFRIKESFGLPSFSLEFFAEHALLLAAIICIVEIVLGVFTIIGLAMRKVAWLLLLLMVFFTFLTWHTATCDPTGMYKDRTTYESTHPQFRDVIKHSADKNSKLKIVKKTAFSVTVDEMKHVQCVTDCGCFGDAMKGAVGRSLSPWESFWKDCILLYLVLWILLANKVVFPNSRGANLYFLTATLILSAVLSWVFNWYALGVFAFTFVIVALWILRSGGKALGNAVGALLLVSLLALSFISYVLLFDPVKDYRPFAVGSAIRWKMNDGKEGVYSSVFLLKNLGTGMEETYSEKEYMSRPELWDVKKFKFVKRDQIELISARLPSISDQFNPSIGLNEIGADERSLNGFNELVRAQTKTEAIRLKDRSSGRLIDVPLKSYSKKDYPDSLVETITRLSSIDPTVKSINLTDWMLDQPIVFVFSSLNLENADWSDVDKIKAIVDYARRTNIPVVMLTRGKRSAINRWKKNYQLQLATFTNDDKGLMMISRSNPNLMILRNGTVNAKYTRLRMPNSESLKKKLNK